MWADSYRHPDRNSDPKATETFQRKHAAYDRLVLNPEQTEEEMFEDMFAGRGGGFGFGEDDDDSDFSDEGPTTCGICMDEKTLGEKVTVLPCGHWFDGECVKTWLVQNGTCPACRKRVE